MLHSASSNSTAGENTVCMVTGSGAVDVGQSKVDNTSSSGSDTSDSAEDAKYGSTKLSTCAGGPWKAPCLGGFSGVMCAICDWGDGRVPTHFKNIAGWCVPCRELGIAWLKLAGIVASVPLVLLLLFQVRFSEQYLTRSCSHRHTGPFSFPRA